MSILQFMEMSIAECILYCVLAFLACISFSSFGRFFAKGKNLALQVLLGMALVGAMIVIALSFWAALAQYIIYSAVVISIVLTINYYHKNKTEIWESIKALLPILFLFTFFIIKLMVYIVPQNGVFDFNCHLTYFAAIPLETFKANYFSRVRIIDVYPYEWSKYHFFNGAFTAIPLSMFIKKNYITYTMAKYLTISIYAGALFEQAKIKKGTKKAIVCFAIGVGCAFSCIFNLTTWSFCTNNYSCILLMGLLWLLFEEEEYQLASIISIILTLSASRMIIIGGVLFIYALFKLYEQNNAKIKILLKNEWKCEIYALIVGMGILSMAFSGVSIQSDISFSLSHFYDVLFDRGWSYILPLGVFGQEGGYYVGLEYLILILYAYMIWEKRGEIKFTKFKEFSAIMRFALIIIGITILYIIGFSCYTVIFKIRNVNQIFFNLVMLLFLYVIPLTVILLGSKDKVFVLLFVIAAIMEYAVFHSSICVSGYSTIFIPLVMSFSNKIVDDLWNCRKKKMILTSLVCLSLIRVGIYDFKTPFFAEDGDHYHILLDLQEVAYTEEAFEYYSSNDADLAKLNALKGNRIHYNVKPTRDDIDMYMTSMSMSFAIDE